MDKMKGKQLPLCDAQRQLGDLKAQIAASPLAQTIEIASILEDLHGQVTEAFSREDWFMKWGRHFMPSLLGAHATQQCNNFKDPGVQQYGGDLFTKLRDEAADIFESLPAPTPAVRQSSPAQPQQASRAPAGAAAREVASQPLGRAMTNAAPVSMAAFYDRAAG